MTYEEALLELDNPKDGEDYGLKMMGSKTTGEVIVKSKYGLARCSRDWPIPFYPTKEDLSATDYKIISGTGELYK
jgi:hypothetical protein